MNCMMRAPSNDPSLAYAGPSTRHGAERAGISLPHKRVPSMIRLFYRLALAIVTVLVCAGIARPSGGTPGFLVAAIAVSAPDSAGVEQPEGPADHWQEGESQSDVDLKAVESDIDDDDSLWHLPDDAAPAFRWIAVPRQPGRARRAELSLDPSRFAAGTCLPRGPPTV